MVATFQLDPLETLQATAALIWGRESSLLLARKSNADFLMLDDDREPRI